MKSYTILYVEDDVELAEMNKVFLESKGFRVVLDNNGKDALKLYRRHYPDLVLLDILLPGDIDGYEIAESIRKYDATTPVIFLTSLSSSENALKGFDVGADDYIRKDQLIEEIEARITRILKKSLLRNGIVKIGDKSFFHIGTAVLTVCNEEFRLSNSESVIFNILLNHVNTTVMREDIVKHAWFNKTGTNNYLSKAITNIRKYLKKDDSVTIKANHKKGLSLCVTYKTVY